ncbi:hypothetical protein KL920_003489 [Ogataea angusta]|nr:hypothetical protein KL920_003489 [Ogataea angusta]
MSVHFRRLLTTTVARRNTAVKSAAAAAEAGESAAGQLGPNVIQDLKHMSRAEFEELLNSTPLPTLNRDDLAVRKFRELFKAFLGRTQNDEFASSRSMIAEYPNLVPTAQRDPYSEPELVVRKKYHDKVLGELGAEIKGVYRPHELITNPPSGNQVTVQKLLAAGAHLGHFTKLWKHTTQPYIYGVYNDLHIIDLEQTRPDGLRGAQRAEAGPGGDAERAGQPDGAGRGRAVADPEHRDRRHRLRPGAGDVRDSGQRRLY